MDVAVLTSPVWWVARHWLRLLTALAVVAAALGPVRLAPAVAAEPTPAAAAQALPTAAAPAPPTVVMPAPPTAPVARAASDAGTTATTDHIVAEQDPVAAAQPHARPRQQLPPPVARPASADVAPVGRRAPPPAGTATA